METKVLFAGQWLDRILPNVDGDEDRELVNA